MRFALGSLLALVVASCPTLAPLASAQTAERHACCPTTPDEAPGPDCCVRAAAPASGVLLAPQLLVVAAVSAQAARPPALEPFRRGSAAVSPPAGAFLFGLPSRAPPAVLA